MIGYIERGTPSIHIISSPLDMEGREKCSISTTLIALNLCCWLTLIKHWHVHFLSLVFRSTRISQRMEATARIFWGKDAMPLSFAAKWLLTWVTTNFKLLLAINLFTNISFNSPRLASNASYSAILLEALDPNLIVQLTSCSCLYSHYLWMGEWLEPTLRPWRSNPIKDTYGSLGFMLLGIFGEEVFSPRC